MRRIDRFDISGTHSDMKPYSVANITISNVDKLKIVDTFSSVPKNPGIGHQHSLSLSLPSQLRPYLCHVWILTSRTCHTHFSPSYDHIYHRIVRGSYSMHARIFSRNIRACASMHTRTLGRNVPACASSVIRAHASASILAHTYVCLFFHARSSTSIRDHGGCSACLSVVLSNTLLWSELGHISKTAHVYIRGALGYSLYHIPESLERWSLQWLSE